MGRLRIIYIFNNQSIKEMDYEGEFLVGVGRRGVSGVGSGRLPLCPDRRAARYNVHGWVGIKMYYPSDIVILFFLLLLLAGVVAGIKYLLGIGHWVKPLLMIVGGAVFVLALIFWRVILIVAVFSIFEANGLPELLDRYIPAAGPLKIVELDKFETFYGKHDDRYYFTVLIKNPPKNADELKKVMQQYYNEKTQHINAVDKGCYVGKVKFYKYMRRTAYFKDNDEDNTGFSIAYLDLYRDTWIGYIEARQPCGGDSTKYEDRIYMYDKNGKLLFYGGEPLSDCYALNFEPFETDTTFVDTRDGKTYRKVTVGTQTWMAKNLNYDVPRTTADVCYFDWAKHCATYGRLYDWNTAKRACPAGWHLPSRNEWDTLVDYCGGRPTAGTKLKSSTGWDGTDDYGFSALPGGSGYKTSNSIYSIFSAVGSNGNWWSATEADDSDAWYMNMESHDGYATDKTQHGNSNLLSVRCIKDATKGDSDEN